MSFGDAVRTCFRKYFTFSGRASRSEYWWFILFLFLGQIVAGIVDTIVFGTGMGDFEAADEAFSPEMEGNGPLAALFGLVTFIPSLSAGWRRMHDTGRSGIYLFYPLLVIFGIGAFAAFSGFGGGSFDGVTGAIMIVALIVLLISPLIVLWWLTRPSQPGTNEYGPNPHEVST